MAAVVLLLPILGLSACTTYRGLAEFDAYRSAFDKSYETGNAVLDLLAQKERSLYLKTYPPQALAFDPDLASYYVDTVDPPSTAVFRRSLTTVKAYNDVLYGLASGEAAEALSARLLGLGTSVTAAGRETRELLAGGVMPKAAASTVRTLDARLSAAGELVTFALKYKSRADFRRFALDYHDECQQILLTLREGARDVFPILTAEEVDSITSDMKKIPIYRKLLSDWVLSIDATIVALERVNAALKADASALDASIAGLTRSAIELEAAAGAARKHIAELAAN